MRAVVSAEPPESDFYVVIPTSLIDLGPHAVAVYAVLRDFADMRSHECWPSHKSIAARAKLSERKVQSVLHELRRHGWLTWTQRKSGSGTLTSNVYHLYGSQARHDMHQVAHDMHQGASAPDAPPSAPDAEELLPIELLPIQEPMPTAVAACFDDFWAIWPYKKGKGQALKTWNKAIKTTDPAVIVAGARQFADDPNKPADKTKWPYPSRWLSEGRWDDEPYAPELNGRGPSATHMFADVALGLTGLEIAQ